MSGKSLKYPEMIKGDGRVKELELISTLDISVGRSNRTMSPYTPFIPLKYLSRNYNNYSYDNISGCIITRQNIDSFLNSEQLSRLDDQEVEELVIIKEKLFREPGLVYKVIAGGRGKMRTYMELQEFMHYHKQQPVDESYGNAINSSTKEMQQVFLKFSAAVYILPSYQGTIGTYSLSVGGKYHILATILPHNLYYQRLHMALTGTVDLSKVIFLIDQRLEDETFELPGLRKLYLGRLKPGMRETTGQLWFVPQEYIQENCFTSSFRLQSRTRNDRAKEHESLVGIFKGYVVNNTIDMMSLYRPEENKQNGELGPIGPLVDSVSSSPLVSDRFAELQGQLPTLLQMTSIMTGLPASQLSEFTTFIEDSREQILNLAGLSPLREGAVSNSTIRPLVEHIIVNEESGELPF